MFGIDLLHMSHNASGLEANIWILVTKCIKQSMFALKIFFFRYGFMGRNVCGIKKHLYFVKLIMRMVSYIPLGNILVDDPLSRISRKGWIFLVSYKHYITAKRRSFKPLTTNDLCLLKLRIKSTSILASIPDAWKSSIGCCSESFQLERFYLGQEVRALFCRLRCKSFYFLSCYCPKTRSASGDMYFIWPVIIKYYTDIDNLMCSCIPGHQGGQDMKEEQI